MTERRSSARERRVALAGEDERQRDGAVEQVGAAGLAGALAGPETSSTSSRSWKASPMRRPNAPSASAVGAPPPPQRAERAGGLEQPRGLQLAAAQVALDASRARPRRRRAAAARPRASAELASRERAQLRRRGRCARAREGARRTAGRRSRSPPRGPPRRPPSAVRGAAARRRARRRGRAWRVWTSSTAAAARTRPVAVAARLAAGREEHEQRAQPLAARGDRRAGVRGQDAAPCAGGDLAPGGARRAPAARARARRRPRRSRRPPRAARRGRACHPARGLPGVDRDDAARGQDVADVAQAGARERGRELARGREALHRVRQVGVGVRRPRRGRCSGTRRSNQTR